MQNKPQKQTSESCGETLLYRIRVTSFKTIRWKEQTNASTVDLNSEKI